VTDRAVSDRAVTDRIVAAEVLVTSPGRNFVALKIVTAEGLVGWGDATLNGRELAVATYLREHVCPILLGRDPARIEDTWQYLYRGVYWRRGAVTMAAIARSTWRSGHQGQSRRHAGLPAARRRGTGPGALLHARHRRRHARVAGCGGRDAGPWFPGDPVQTGVPGLGQVYGVSSGGGGLRAGQPGCRPVVETWDTDAYLRHVPGALAQVRAHVGPELALLHDAHHRLTPNQAARWPRR